MYVLWTDGEFIIDKLNAALRDFLEIAKPTADKSLRSLSINVTSSSSLSMKNKNISDRQTIIRFDLL
jgi:hypothetical protein